jgi:integrase
MQGLPKRWTNSTAAKLAVPPAGYLIYWCPDTPGLGVRVSKTGDRAYIAQRRVEGKTVRRTLGKAAGAGAVSIDTARALQLDVSSELQQGKDRLEVRRERIKAEKVEAVTFELALRLYVKNKRRAKDGLPLKARTIADYLAMIAPPTATRQAGELYPIAGRPIHKVTAEELRDLHALLAPRGERRQTYAMQVTRAVLRHEGVTIPDNPLSPTTAGAKRVALAPSRGNPFPIPPERLGAWWRAASAIDSPSADQARFLLLTGCRPGEASLSEVRDFDSVSGTLKLDDTKNRLDHTIMLSKQALAIARKHAKGKRPGERLFGVEDVGKTLATINVAAGVDPRVTAHKLRHTFASVAEELVSAGTLKAMLNHVTKDDVTQTHYVGKSATQMRTGWQTVADFIVRAAK